MILSELKLIYKNGIYFASWWKYKNNMKTNSFDKNVKTECLINSQKIAYDVCSQKDLKEARKFYKNYKHIGSGYVYYLDGVIYHNKKLLHFFIG